MSGEEASVAIPAQGKYHAHHASESPLREPLIRGDKSYHQITEDICSPTENKPGLLWFIAIGISSTLLGIGSIAVLVTIFEGIGMWGVNKTIDWGWGITNFVWWVGIGHAGTLISAVLLLFRQGWRTGVNRAAEAMTIFAVVCAGQFPLLHAGRPMDDIFRFSLS